MNIALFSDATSQPMRKAAGISAIAYDVTVPHLPREVFRCCRRIPFCESNVAEHHAIIMGLDEILAQVDHGSLQVESLAVFTDADTITQNLVRREKLLKVRTSQVRDLQEAILERIGGLHASGCVTEIHVISRELNRNADALAHVALGLPSVATPLQGLGMIDRFPFLKTLNS